MRRHHRRSLTAAAAVSGPLIFMNNNSCDALFASQQQQQHVASTRAAWAYSSVFRQASSVGQCRARRGNRVLHSSATSLSRRRQSSIGSSSKRHLQQRGSESSPSCLFSLAERGQERAQHSEHQQQHQKVIVIREDAREALAKGDVYTALVLLEQNAGTAFQDATTIASNAHASESVTETSPLPSGERSPTGSTDRIQSAIVDTGINLGTAHARLIELLWRAGHQEEALETFDLARTRAREAAEIAAAAQGRRAPCKPGAGVPGLFLDLPADICHGIMRAKQLEQNSQAVIEAMRACSRVPRRKLRSYGTVSATVVSVKGDSEGANRKKGSDTDSGVDSAGVSAGGGGWAPTEETYSIALQECGRVQKRWGFKAALFFIQEMRDAQLDIELAHYRAAILACSRTRQLAGVLPLLDEMRARGLAADVETYNSAISSCTVAQVQRALNLVHMMRSDGLAPTEITYNVLLRLCGLGGCWAMGLELMEMMEEEGLAPTLHHYNSLFMALEHAERWREAASLFRKLRANGLRPNALTYGPLIGVLDKCKKRKMAAAVLEEMLVETPRDSTRAYNLLLNACAKARKWEHAQKLFKHMGECGMEPDMVTYNTVINALGRCGRVVEATVHLNAMKEQGLSPDLVTFGTLIHASAQSGRREAALALFAEMVSRGLKPNLEAYKGCIVSCQKAGKFKQALELFDGMSKDRVRKDRVVYNTVIACCAQLKLWRRGVALLDEMHANGVNPDHYTYNTAIYACVKAKQPAQMTMVLARMRGDGFSPDVMTYHNLIRCLADSMLWRRAVSVLDDMINASRDKEEGVVRPDAHCFNGAINACAKAGQWTEAERLVIEMRGQGIKPDYYTYNSMMNAYAVSGEWVKALTLLDEMQMSGVKINSMTYSSAIKACDKGLQWERAVELLAKMAIDGTKPNLFAYNYAMSACVRGNQPELAWQLLGKMKSEGLKMDRMSYGVLMFLYSRAGQWGECIRVNQEMRQEGFEGDWYSYHAMLVALSKGEQWEQAVQVFDEMRRSSSARPDGSCYGTMFHVCKKGGFWQQALDYLREMPSVGVRPVLVHFKQALRACENARERVGESRETTEEWVEGAADAMPVIFSLMRECDITPDDDCYALATRTYQHAGRRNAQAELMEDIRAKAAVKRLEGPALPVNRRKTSPGVNGGSADVPPGFRRHLGGRTSNTARGTRSSSSRVGQGTDDESQDGHRTKNGDAEVE